MALDRQTLTSICMLFILFQIGRDRYALSASGIIEALPLINLKRVPCAPAGGGRGIKLSWNSGAGDRLKRNDAGGTRSATLEHTHHSSEVSARGPASTSAGSDR